MARAGGYARYMSLKHGHKARKVPSSAACGAEDGTDGAGEQGCGNGLKKWVEEKGWKKGEKWCRIDDVYKNMRGWILI